MLAKNETISGQDIQHKNLSALTGRYRWTICALLFFATTINYLDRTVISLLKSDLEKQFQWSESDYANIVISFQLAYALGMLGVGRLIDKIGTKAGYALSLALWSLASLGHAFVRNTMGFILARGGLGVSESGNFPAAIKTVAEWFPKKERAFATGIFNSGANIGAILAPLSVPYIAVHWGWKWAFVITGGVGLVWLIFWIAIYDIPSRHKKVSRDELTYIHGDNKRSDTNDDAADKGSFSWFLLLGKRQTWAFLIGKFLTDPIWYFYLFWLPAFLKAQYQMQGVAVSLPIAVVYIMSSMGSIGGGWLPLFLVRRNWPLLRARKTSMFLYALFVVPVIFAQLMGSLNSWWAVSFIGLAAACHQAWSANIFTTVSDLFPKKAVASVTGIGGTAGALGGILIAWGTGKILDHYKAMHALETGYYIMFLICGCAYLTAWLVMHFLNPKSREVKL